MNCKELFNHLDQKAFLDISELKPIVDRDLGFKVLKEVLFLLYGYEEEKIKNNSSSKSGALHFFNWTSSNSRNKSFEEKICKGFKEDSNNIIIAAEGDSWFQYPWFVKDIIDYLKLEPNLAVFSVAYGGDWLANIREEEQYEYALKKHNPKYFLISGGGNDMVGKDFDGKGRIRKLVHAKKDHSESFVKNVYTGMVDPGLNEFECNLLELGRSFYTQSMFTLFNVIQLQYFLIFSKIARDFPEVKVISQGYDYPLPSSSWGFGWRPWLFHRPLTNSWQNGKWMDKPLKRIGIKNKHERRAIGFAIIHDFNEIMIRLQKEFKNVHHLDLRNTVSKKEWYNELHPDNKGFKKIAEKYKEIINELEKP